jgi:hypothetical protein
MEAHQNQALASLRVIAGEVRGPYEGLIQLLSIAVNVAGSNFGPDDLRDLHTALGTIRELNARWAALEKSSHADIVGLLRSKEVETWARVLILALAEVDVDARMRNAERYRDMHQASREAQDRAAEEREHQRRLSELRSEAMRMSPADIIRGAETNGVTLSVDAQGNVISHPHGHLNGKSRELIKLRRAEIAALLTERARVEAII